MRFPLRTGCWAVLAGVGIGAVLTGCASNAATQKSSGAPSVVRSSGGRSEPSGTSPTTSTASTRNGSVGTAATSTSTAPATAATTPPTTQAPTTQAPTTQGPTPAQRRAAAQKKAVSKIKPFQKLFGPGGISIKAVNTATGATFSYGADSGMRTGSIIKLYILETLLLQHQQRGTHLSSYERSAAAKMIENSDNAAASALFDAVGGKSGLDDVRDDLNLHCTRVDGDEFGLTKTCASDFVNLVRAANQPGPLTKNSRSYILGLQAQVEDDQRWGVSAAADKGTTTHLKNGWLDVDADNGKWLINSVGSLTVHGDPVYLAVLTQHGPAVGEAYENGQARVEKLAKIAAAVVAPG